MKTNTLFFVTGDMPNNTFHQMSATTNYLQNDSPLKLQSKSPTRSAGTQSQYLLMMNKIRERPHKS